MKVDTLISRPNHFDWEQHGFRVHLMRDQRIYLLKQSTPHFSFVARRIGDLAAWPAASDHFKVIVRKDGRMLSGQRMACGIDDLQALTQQWLNELQKAPPGALCAVVYEPAKAILSLVKAR